MCIEPFVVYEEDQLITDVEEIVATIQTVGAENVLCVFSTTSCFAPRAPDQVVEIAKVCKRFDVFHVVNNAYGLQCGKITNELNQAHR